ncbi:MAG: 30S ribosomal protein S15 [Flavobacteriales bacterium]|tara:strand:+ start:956 stop:1231 length:276 start_codon:yes stop_codon:yes gene_type:complete
MSLTVTAEKKKEIFAKFGKSENDTGSTEGQIALFTARITHLTDHLKENKKDFVSKRSLIRAVGKRRSLLDYLKAKDIEKYRALISELGLRK